MLPLNAPVTSERNDEAIAVYDELIQRFNLDETPAIQELVASAFVNKGVRLGHLAGAAYADMAALPRADIARLTNAANDQIATFRDLDHLKAKNSSRYGLIGLTPARPPSGGLFYASGLDAPRLGIAVADASIPRWPPQPAGNLANERKHHG